MKTTTQKNRSEFYKTLTPYMATAIAEGFCEGEGATREEQLDAWQYIHDKGLARQLQGWFGRSIASLIAQGLIEDGQAPEMERKTVDHGNGHSTTYKITASGTAYHEETPQEVVNVLERARAAGTRLQFYYGDVKTGRDWHEENDTIGTIGRSGGSVKIPLLIKSSRSHGGGAILDHCIVKIVETRTKKVLYKAANYQAPKIEIVPSDLPGYSHNVNIDGQLYSRHKTERAAKMLAAKLS